MPRWILLFRGSTKKFSGLTISIETASDLNCMLQLDASVMHTVLERVDGIRRLTGTFLRDWYVIEALFPRLSKPPVECAKRSWVIVGGSKRRRYKLDRKSTRLNSSHIS